MKKNNYKPRMVEFIMHNDFTRTAYVDTRKGKNGFYPGDEIKDGFSSKLILGVEQISGLLVFADSKYRSCIYDMIGVCNVSNLITRHGQRLIDNGEMIQAEELNG